ncbi:transposase [Nostoc punctiforme]|nr:transposase [Nostoc punctiforme]
MGLPFKELLPTSVIEQAMKELKIRYYRQLFDPIVTIWAFLSQVLDTDKSCHNTVSKVISYLAGQEVELPSTDTSSYCQARKTSMRKGKIVGSCDKLVTWYKPEKCPKGLSKDEFYALPLTINLREIYYYIVVPGFRTEQVSLITTLLDITTYSTLDIVGLYGKRWDVEIDLRHLKTTLGMDVLRCKTPSMVRKEIYVYLLAYNLLRGLMWSSGTTYRTPPLRLSLQATCHHLNNFIPELLAATSTKRLQIYCNAT